LSVSATETGANGVVDKEEMGLVPLLLLLMMFTIEEGVRFVFCSNLIAVIETLGEDIGRVKGAAGGV